MSSVEKLKKHAHDFGHINKHSVFGLVKELVELAEKIVKGSGHEKQEAVLNVLRIIIEEMPESDDKRDLMYLLNDVIPSAIDLAIAVAHSPEFNGIWTKIKRCCK